MFNRYRSQGFFLASKERGESDKIFTVYTKDFGKISLFAKGIRKAESKLRFGTNSFALDEIEFIEGRNYRTLTDIRIVNNYQSISKNLSARSLVEKAFSDIGLLTKEEQKDEKIWQSLISFLERVNKEADLSVYFHLIWKVFSFLGYQPELENCVLCSQKVQEEFWFSGTQGGVIGRCCLDKTDDYQKITLKEKNLLKAFLERDLNSLKVDLGINAKKRIQMITEEYLKCVILR
jgi:DNA repair protein RecO (recombination protein O)